MDEYVNINTIEGKVHVNGESLSSIMAHYRALGALLSEINKIEDVDLRNKLFNKWDNKRRSEQLLGNEVIIEIR